MDHASRRIIVTCSSPAIQETRQRNELRMFREAGFEVSVYCWDRTAEHNKHEVRDGTSVRHCRIPGSYANKTVFLSLPLWWLCEFFYLLFHPADGIHACDFDTAAPALVVKWLKRTKLVFDIYDFYAPRTRNLPKFLRSSFAWAEQLCVRKSDGVIVVDESRKQMLGWSAPRRLVVAANCPYDSVNPEWQKPMRNELVILYAGPVARLRGLRKLVRVTRGLERVRILVAGPVKDRSYLKLFDGAPHVEYLGNLHPSDVIEQTFMADAIYSYHDPGVGLNHTPNSSGMFEAFMCSTAVLCNAESPSTDVVSTFNCGARLPYHDDEGLRNTILHWRDHSELHRELGENGRRLFETRFDWKHVSQRILNVYRELGLH
ncbi:MAG: glycosyltransferase [Candidatus Hydrogenedentes bacterium]|nr:glycosyltransferase [Candidatus Hydrogenedentota bacterium]